MFSSLRRLFKKEIKETEERKIGFTKNSIFYLLSPFFSKIVLFSLFMFLLLLSCKENPTTPNEAAKPPGYQEDIPWPSLADSPWPMFRGNPQYTGRSKFNGPNSGILQWTFDSVHIESGAIISGDNSILFQTSRPAFNRGGIFKLTPTGDLQWYYEINEIASGTTPLILSDLTIIVSTYVGGKIIALTKNGIEKWSFDTGTYITTRGMNVGIDGTIYFQDSTRTLFALGKDGNLRWTLKIESIFFGSGNNASMAFSPDGKVLYITGADKAIYAVDVNQRGIIWSYGSKNAIASPLVDSKGNIYLYGIPDRSEGEVFYLSKLNPSGSLVWKYSVKNIGWEYYLEPTMDHNGNVYFGFGSDSLYSVDYNGSIRWKIDLRGTFDGIISSPLTTDKQNNIYVPIQKSDGINFKILAFKDNGSLLWQTDWLFGETGDSPCLGIGSLYFPTYRSTSFYSIK